MKKVISIILACMITCTIAACRQSNDNVTQLNVYFRNTQTNSLSVETVSYQGDDDVSAMANFVMKALENGPKAELHSNPLPNGTRFNTVSVSSSTATVDFSKQFLNSEGIDEVLARFAVVSTLCDIPGIDKVLITTGGEPIVSKATGELIGTLSKNDIVYDTDALQEQTTDTTRVTLYFANSDATALKAEVRRVETQSSLSMEKTVITELLKGPESDGLISVIPPETKLLNLETSNGVCFVNFSAEFVTKFTGGTSTGMLIVYSIVNSLSSLEDVDSVQILIEGKTGAEFGDFVFDEPFFSNNNIVEKK